MSIYHEAYTTDNDSEAPHDPSRHWRQRTPAAIADHSAQLPASFRHVWRNRAGAHSVQDQSGDGAAVQRRRHAVVSVYLQGQDPGLSRFQLCVYLTGTAAVAAGL
ncbi:hypothetical protein D3C79_769800 [compost metagenome]